MLILDGDNFDHAVQDFGPLLVKFYAPVRDIGVARAA